MMYEFIRDHAIRNIWCTPDQDKQVIFKPARISRGAGIKNDIRIAWDQYKLPTPNEKYHVYQIGQLHPIIVGLIEEVYKWHPSPAHPTVSSPGVPEEYYSSDNVWFPFDYICNQQNMVADFYIENGLQLPRHTTYAMVTDDKNLVIAVKDQPKIVTNLYLQNFYIRFYSNAFFGSQRSDSFPHEIYVKGRVVTSPVDIVNFNQEINNRINVVKPKGQIFIYINGFLYNELNVINAQAGDIVEYMHDTTVKAVVNIPIAGVSEFDSTLDLKRKYLLTYPESDVNDLIDFHDDIDFYLVRQTAPSLYPERFTGCYYHKNAPDAVRMVTHKDYAIVIPYVAAYVNDHEIFDNTSNNVIVRLYIREAGYDRALSNEHNRIKELYKLTDEQVTGAMVGINATLPNWRAEVLEASMYTYIMRCKSSQINKENIQSAYGYNAISKIFADVPIPVEEYGNIKYAPLPPGLRTHSTVFELDVNGYVLGWFHHQNDSDYFPRFPACVKIDAVMGEPTNHLDMIFGEHSSVLSPYLTYKMYKTRIITGVIQWDEWEDVTGTGDYLISGNIMTWTVNHSLWYTCLKSDYKTLCYNLTLDQEDHLLTHTIANEETHSSVTSIKQLDIPPANLDIWLNGKYLIENLDYFCNWPDVVVTNKEYLIEGQIQNLTIRGTGFCTVDMEIETPDEFGFVINGVMSRDTVFDIRDDKVLLISVEGSLLSRDTLIFAENLPTVQVPGVRNGAPYVVKDVIVPMRDATILDTNVLRAQSIAVDTAVSNYLTQFIDEVPDPLPNIIPRQYNIFSPFCSKIIYDIINGVLVIPGIYGFYNEMDIAGWLAGYEYLLPFDPCTKSIDANYVTIHPHPLYRTLELDVYQYTFIERMAALYLSSKVDLTLFVSMSMPVIDTTAPTVPTGLTATAVNDISIDLSWDISTDTLSGVSGYRIYRDAVQIAIIANATSFTNSGVAIFTDIGVPDLNAPSAPYASTSYTYTVAAVDSAGNVSAQSLPATATTLAPAP